MKQMFFDLDISSNQTLENFFVGKNNELIGLLNNFVNNTNKSKKNNNCITIWGESGSGKSHLFSALSQFDHSKIITEYDNLIDLNLSTNHSLYLIDNFENLSNDFHKSIFFLYNQIMEANKVLIIFSGISPRNLKIKKDLQSRILWGLVYQLYGLSDEDKISAILQTTKIKGIKISKKIVVYLLTHFKRDMNSLSNIIHIADQLSLETKRPITIQMIREIIRKH
tara:strand:+ start:309 stop:980 length:672 start_codon:yes stop_codon:yes gene_type:complete